MTTAVRSTPGATTRLHLLDRMELRHHGACVALPDSSKRLLALLALRERHQHRSTVAGTLWTDTTEDRAAANLRTALWRVRRFSADLILSEGAYLRIGRHVRVDLAEVTEATRRLVADPHARDEPHLSAETLCQELLPEWPDDWVLLERERLRQLRLHGLEALCLRFTALGRHALAIEAGLLAVAAEPLRETTQRALIAAHVSEGNMSEAVRQYDTYRELLQHTLGIEPSDNLRAVVAPCR
ncbi:MAG TPA: BTAD domain-containing putative transcriptional regulator [Rugosimonospora sp.]|nr:BTAD domain-containing putative transcriptional regulator [Rugosimonospora sp.]